MSDKLVVRYTIEIPVWAWHADQRDIVGASIAASKLTVEELFSNYLEDVELLTEAGETVES